MASSNARGRRAWADGGAMSDAARFGMVGWRTGNPNVPGQQSLEGLEHGAVEHDARFQRLSKFTDLPKGAKGATSRATTQADVLHGRHNKSGEKVAPGLEDYGLTARSVRGRFGGLLDRAMERAQRSGSTTPVGQHFYGVTERAKIADAARTAEIPFETMTAMTALTSPQVPWSKNGRDVNLGIAEDIAHHSAAGLPGLPKVETGLPEQMAVAQDVWDDPSKTTYDVTRGPKVQSFHQNFTHPYHPEGRATIDTHMIAGAAPHITEKAQREQMLKKRGVYEFFDHHLGAEASKRGLSVEEAQSVAWHQHKYENETGATGRNVHDTAMAKQASMEGTGEMHGQRDLFGGEVRRAQTRHLSSGEKVAEARRNLPLQGRQWRPGEPI